MFTGSVTPAANSGAVIQSVVMDYGDGTTQPLGAITGTAIALHHVYVDFRDLHRDVDRHGQQRRRRKISDVRVRASRDAVGGLAHVVAVSKRR